MRVNTLIYILLIGFLGHSVAAQSPDTGWIYPMGIPNAPDAFYETLPAKAEQTSAIYRDVPPAFSLKPYCPVPGNQGRYGTCTAWAVGYSARSILEAVRYGWRDPYQVQREAFSAGFLYRVTNPTTYDCDGAYVSETLEKLRQVGTPKYRDCSESCLSYASNSLYEAAKAYKIPAYERLWSESYSSVSDKYKIQTVKKSLSEKRPVVISMICPRSFQRASGVWQPTESPNNSQSWQHGRHAICVVGYDDTKYGGAFEIINSWGTGWGNNGFMWITYNDFAQFVYQAYEMMPATAPIEPPKPKPEPKPEPKPTPPALISLSGGLRCELYDGGAMPVGRTSDGYAFKNAYTSGTRFRLYISSKEAAYVYALGADNNNDLTPIFPYKPLMSAALTYGKNEIAIPNERQHLRLNAQTGKDYICLIYSKEALNFEYLQQQIKAQSGHFPERVRKALGQKVERFSSATTAADEASFSVKTTADKVFVLFVEMTHL